MLNEDDQLTLAVLELRLIQQDAELAHSFEELAALDALTPATTRSLLARYHTPEPPARLSTRTTILAVRFVLWFLVLTTLAALAWAIHLGNPTAVLLLVLVTGPTDLVLLALSLAVRM